MSSPQPAISVLMPVYNSAYYLQQAIDSILNQTLPNFELIIIDDGSSDGSPQIIEKYNDSRIVVLRNDENIGLPGSLNRGISVARGKYIARNDADDISRPERFQKQFELLENEPAIGLLGTAIQVIASSGNSLRVGHFPSQNSVLQWRLLFSNPFAHSSVMFRRDLVLQLGGYNTVVAEDYDLWLRISRHTMLKNMPEKLVYLRRYPGTYTMTHVRSGKISAAASSLVRIQEILNKPVSRAAIETVWGIQTSEPDEVFRAADVVVDLLKHDSFINIEVSNRSLIEQDAARRIFKLQTQRCLSLQMRSVLFKKAIRLDPFLLLRVASNRVMLAFNRPLYG